MIRTTEINVFSAPANNYAKGIKKSATKKEVVTTDLYKQSNFKRDLQEIKNIDQRMITNLNKQYSYYNGFLHDIRDEVQKPNVVDNSIEIKRGDVFSLGNYQGEKIVAKRRDNGYLISSTGGGTIKLENTMGRVTAHQKRAAEIVDSYSKEQHQAAAITTDVLSSLLLVVDGEESVEFFNEKFSSPRYKNIDIKKEISRIGINVDDVFTVNGEKFNFDQRKLIKF